MTVPVLAEALPRTLLADRLQEVRHQLLGKEDTLWGCSGIAQFVLLSRARGHSTACFTHFSAHHYETQ